MLRHLPLRPVLPLLVASTLCGIIGSLGTVLVLATIGQILNGRLHFGPEAAAGFMGLALFSVAGSGLSDILTNMTGQRITAAVRIDLARRMLTAPLAAIEKPGPQGLLPVLGGDVDMISDVAFAIGAISVSAGIAIGCLIYLAWLSLALFLWLLPILVIGGFIQFRARDRGIKGFWAGRAAEDRLHAHYRTIIDGARELRLDRRRRARIFQHEVIPAAQEVRQVTGRAIAFFVGANALGTLLLFAFITLVLTHPAMLPRDQMTSFILILLFLKGPIDQMMHNLPVLGRAQVAIRRIADLTARFTTFEPNVVLTEAPDDTPRVPARIALDGITYDYPQVAGAAPFSIGPIDLTFQRGEIVFIVGENGSGKTSLIKLLLGLMEPAQGQITVDGVPVTHETRDDYRQLFHTIFSDFHLFEDGPPPMQGAALDRWLDRLDLAHKVSVQDGVFTTTDLSTGQRKRLALVQAIFTKRPIMVFDEWAADQDPTFRRTFYTEILPELAAQGATVIVISHDDRYFHIANRLITMENGRMIESVSA
ncbi:cyclic peptide export ABC transporter [Acidisoma silvae]|uniref:Cyclic peptide export ABC transporter n=1 Tax=Acidisoma silvae TaxID=2802396 RepID=A0A963YPY7_9PROT|nr:cyclic peptide export ABC transporter [Acidisoma silvae]MCB8874449.1 cyclic peptide export ABC transporter [Acidisoma silvae]